ncbi:hypothetical protein RJ639_030639 [Escallonia herrerae]|uniref:Reverse transcriptase domain-containing protein n=1 Tax=Escallonia herrerae TaxID=1293975 RepID=A0AA89BDD6_9ASTE|nr:hypothetical protein RJ639_030639 [Escallonia herrerae]
MDLYMDNMLIKSIEAEAHVNDLKETFDILRAYNVTLNPLKCAFGVALGKFLGFMIFQRGIETNPEKIDVIHDTKSPKTIKQVQELTGRIAALGGRGSGTGLILISPEKFMIEYALCFDFQASNNEVEYEELLAWIRLAYFLRVDSLSAHIDSQLVVNHILGEYGVKDDRMALYLQGVKTEASKFKNFAIRHIPRDQNTRQTHCQD